MKLTKIERDILIEIFNSGNGLFLFSIHRQLGISPKDLFLAIENLKKNKLLEINEERVTITKEGVDFAINTPLKLGTEKLDKKITVEEFMGPKIKINEFYIPQNFQK